MKKLLWIVLFVLVAVPAFASVNVLTGGVSHRQELFSAPGGPMALSMRLSYHSYDRLDGPLGVGWSHAYDIYLHRNSDGTQVLTGGVGKRFYFPDGSGGYIARTGDYSTLTANPDGTFTLNFPGGTVYQFGTDKKISSIADRFGNTLSFDYSSVADQLTVTDPAGRQALIHTDENGHVDYIRDPSGEQGQYDFTYNATSGLLETVSYPAPDSAAPTVRPVWNYKYTAENLLEYVTDAEGHISKYGYANGKCIRVVDPEGVIDTNGAETADVAQHTKTFDYDLPATGQTTLTEKDGGPWIYSTDVSEGVLTAKQDPLGNVTSYAFYSTGEAYPGLRKSITSPIDADTVYITEYLAYDAAGNATEIKGHVRHLNGGSPIDDAADRHLVLTYDSYDRLTSATDQITGALSTIGYVLDGGTGAETVTITAPKINAADPSGPQSVLLYRPDGRLDLVTDPLGRQIDYAYDANGLLQSATDLTSGIVSTFGDLDAMRRPQTVTVSATGETTRVTHVSYDALGRVKTVTRDGSEDPQTQQIITYVTSFAYDLLGNRTSVTDAESNSTDFEHNYRGQVTKITDALNQVTELLYSGAGCAPCGGGVDKLTDVINARHYYPGSTLVPKASFRYDEIGRVKSESDELGNTLLYAYDAAGRLTETYLDQDGNGAIDVGTDQHLLSYSWSGDGKLQSKTDHLTGETTTYSYYPLPTAPATDPRAGRLMTAGNASVSYTFDYFDNGWLKSVDDGATQVEYAYDAAGRRELVTVKQGATTLQSLDYVYNATSKRLESIVSSAAGSFGFTYDGWGRRKTLTYPGANPVVATYSYDADMDWLTGIDYSQIGVSLGYPVHDKVGNRKQRTEDGVATDYAYDDTYQLTQAKTGPSEENFTYDKVGNRRAGPTVKEVLDQTYVHNAANQMTKGRKYSYTYDDFGNIRTVNIFGYNKFWLYTWDADNRLVRAELHRDNEELRRISYKYDPFGRRIQKDISVKISDNVAVGTVIKYVYDGEDIVLQTIQRDVTENYVVTYTYTTIQYVHGPGIDEPLAMVKDGQSYFYHADGLGSIVAITDSSQNIVARYGYESFGMVSASDPEFANAYAYTGREWDREVGLYYYRARYYDPMEGRFISKDPIGFAGGDVNVYRYVGNGVGTWIDPWGLAKGDFWDPLTYGAKNVTGGVSMIGFDFNAFTYDESGVEWNLNMGISTTLFGAGIQVNYEGLCGNGIDEDSDLYVSFSGPSILSKYFGASFTPDFRNGSLNIGAGIGLPVINFSGSLKSATESVASKLKSSTKATAVYLEKGTKRLVGVFD